MAIVRTATLLEPTGRPAKSTTSIIEKLRRETIRLSQMQDIAGCRLVVQDMLAQDQIVGKLQSAFARVTVTDRRKEPSHGYRAVHVIPTVRNRPIEIQVRTELQHLWAQLSEALSDAFDPTIKYGGGDPKLQEWMSAISALSGELENRESRPGTAERAQRLAEVKQSFRDYLKNAIANPSELLDQND